MPAAKKFRARQMLGKYRIEKRLAHGPRADVYRAYDTIHGIRVALKVANPDIVEDDFLDEFRHEARLSSKMEHPNILPVMNASFVDEYFVIAMRLGSETLGDRMGRRMSDQTALSFTTQALNALSHAHSKRIIHCDVKPENFILFPGNQLRLTDFGFSKVALRTVKASGSGTLGYLAPEQALGRPMFQSDVFALGLVIWQLFSKQLPEYPYDWPMPGAPRIRGKLRRRMIEWLRTALEFRHQDRFRDAVEMQEEFDTIRFKLL
ncbi:MAG: serine/threonine protein kinase [Gammaproteobacteria bacterium]|nr:serine/threonine protein kinase [Gammaproteobacteria bacterium]NND53986.1 serine/threonine protein kinase [Gammaproteobacteria bacterium]